MIQKNMKFYKTKSEYARMVHIKKSINTFFNNFNIDRNFKKLFILQKRGIMYYDFFNIS